MQLRRVLNQIKTPLISGISIVVIVCWLYLWQITADIPSIMKDPQMGITLWSAVDFWQMLVMWMVMMVGMMLPSAVPMLLIYERACAPDDRIATLLFMLGYLSIWLLFSLAATLLQWGLDQAALLSPMMVSSSPTLGAGILIAAGLYQLSPLKHRCLSFCRTPLQFLTTHLRTGRSGALRMGLEHGFFCLGCCWALMGLLFVGGVMNLLWIAIIALFVLMEKVLPYGVQGGRYIGSLMVLVGLYLLF
ncbi:MAG: DUF2182 domain-containing protein [Motiliproteus sp.]